MLKVIIATFYTALMLSANPGFTASPPHIKMEGDMKKLSIHTQPKDLEGVTFVDKNDRATKLADYHGKWVVLNFWATWCGPCRKEMPSLNRLQQKYPEIAVVPLATGRNSLHAIRKFYDKADIKNLPIFRDKKSIIARKLGVIGLPVTLILNPKGQEIARLVGNAEWDDNNAISVIDALTSGP